MRVNLPAETTTYLAEIKDGKIMATYSCGMYIDPNLSVNQIKEEMGDALKNPIPMGYDEFNNTLYFDGAVYSEFN